LRIAGIELLDAAPVAGGDISEAFRAVTDAGQVVFAKRHVSPPDGMFEAEARGLERLRVPGGPPIPRVLGVAADGLVLEWVASGVPSRDAAIRFGRELATMHQSGGDEYGATEPGYLATIPLDNTLAPDWPTFHTERRLMPLLDTARARGGVDDDEVDVIRRVIDRLPDLMGPIEPPALIHGDLWSGNLLWDEDGAVWLIDAASAHCGHRETDLAMLALFGTPYLEEIIASYDAAYPLAAGWRERIPLHQLLPLLAHAVLFGRGYGTRAAAVALAVDS
jgi:fructosamine-3-kinase